jgi:hypothetical protein
VTEPGIGNSLRTARSYRGSTSSLTVGGGEQSKVVNLEQEVEPYLEDGPLTDVGPNLQGRARGLLCIDDFFYLTGVSYIKLTHVGG